MSFREKADSWRMKTGPGKVRLPVLVGLTALAIAVVSSAGVMLFQAMGSDGIVIAREDQRPEPDDGGEHPEGKEDPSIRIHVGGAVATPGVVELFSGSRVCDAIDAAGGFREDAARDALNLARVVNDGEQLIVPLRDAVDATSGGDDPSWGEGAGSDTPKLININRASMEELDTLPGVGVSTAERIIADRTENGPFSAPEDLKRVSGIGDKKYTALADRICVG